MFANSLAWRREKASSKRLQSVPSSSLVLHVPTFLNHEGERDASSAVWRDQTVNRVWQAGIDAHPAKRFSIRLSGNYDRTTGVGEISGEPPTQGPLRFPMVTGTVAYDFGMPGRFSIDLQRAYYIEEIMRGDNFNANVLAIRWTKDF